MRKYAQQVHDRLYGIELNAAEFKEIYYQLVTRLIVSGQTQVLEDLMLDQLIARKWSIEEIEERMMIRVLTR